MQEPTSTMLRFNGPAGRTAASCVAYAYHTLIARKFNSNLPVQLMPTLIHRNYLAIKID